MMKLMRGGNSARCEAERMVREKIDAALEATASLMAGASGEKIVHRYRKRVAANAKRLSRPNSGRSQKRNHVEVVSGVTSYRHVHVGRAGYWTTSSLTFATPPPTIPSVSAAA